MRGNKKVRGSKKVRGTNKCAETKTAQRNKVRGANIARRNNKCAEKIKGARDNNAHAARTLAGTALVASVVRAARAAYLGARRKPGPTRRHITTTLPRYHSRKPSPCTQCASNEATRTPAVCAAQRHGGVRAHAHAPCGNAGGYSRLSGSPHTTPLPPPPARHHHSRHLAVMMAQ